MAREPGTGYELWTSDGTPDGTRLVRDIAPGTANSNPASLTPVNGLLFFTAEGGNGVRQLWVTNGTNSGTLRLSNITPGVAPDDDARFLKRYIAFNGESVFFPARDSEHGAELWARHVR